MAFQSDTLFSGFLRTTVKSAVVAESAPAMNFLLEERLPVPREQIFLGARPGRAPTSWDVSAWLQTYGNHYSDQVALPLRRAVDVSTFGAGNTENHLAVESHQDVVRIESLAALHRRFPGGFDSVTDLVVDLRNLIRSREPGQAGTFSDDQRSRLAEWLDGINDRRDARPAFVAPFDEVETILAAPDWATQLRNVLGLSHLAGTTARPLPVVQCRYNLSRVERAARAAKVAAWATIPTVLEGGSGSGPGAAFFPFPKAAASADFSFGVTVDLTPSGGSDFKSEFLHFRIDYTLDDFVAVGEIIDEVTDEHLATCRQRHLGLLEPDLRYRSEVR